MEQKLGELELLEEREEFLYQGMKQGAESPKREKKSLVKTAFKVGGTAMDATLRVIR
jgi:hypothetical protein